MKIEDLNTVGFTAFVTIASAFLSGGLAVAGGGMVAGSILTSLNKSCRDADYNFSRIR